MLVTLTTYVLIVPPGVILPLSLPVVEQVSNCTPGLRCDADGALPVGCCVDGILPIGCCADDVLLISWCADGALLISWWCDGALPVACCVMTHCPSALGNI